MKVLLGLVFLSILLLGCVQSTKPASETTSPQIACINLCTSEKQKQSLDEGPCIANPLPEFPDWVCDIAHSPRTVVDDLPENQCPAFRQGKANHFIELSPECEFLRQY